MTSSLLVVAALTLGQVAPTSSTSPRFGAPVATTQLPPATTSSDPAWTASPPAPPSPVLLPSPWTLAPLPPDDPEKIGMPMQPGQPVPAAKNGNGTSDKKDNAAKKDNGDKNDNDGKKDNGDDKKDKDNGDKKKKEPEPTRPGFCYNFVKAYCDEFFPKKSNGDDDEPAAAPRRALPEPWSAPPFPGHEYQGYPLVGVPRAPIDNPLMKGLYATEWGDAIKDSYIKVYGWVTSSGNWSNAKNSNTPASYWIVPNHYELDQAVLRFEREADMVQTDHIDYGFRLTGMYGIDYRYTNAGGWGNEQLTNHNLLNGFDPIEVYMDIYIPWVAQGMVLRVGRWVACPDIETQMAPDNYLGSHSLLFTYDTYTQTGVMTTYCLSNQWMFQAGITAGTDMAPWYQGATPTGFFGLRWVSQDNNDATYTCLNNINNARFRYFIDDNGQLVGHDNFNYLVTTWEHRFNANFHTKTETYFMWENDAVLGGTPSVGPLQPYGGGGGIGPTIPGQSRAYGVLNYTAYAFTKSDFITVRNEWWRDETGFRSGFPGNYTSHTIGITHNFNSLFQIRPEIGYYRNWTEPAFDLGTKKGIWIYGFDMTMHF